MITYFRSLFAPPRHLVLIVVTLWVGLTLSEKRAEQHGISKEGLNKLVAFSMLGYVVGGRLLFALANLSAFRQSPLNIFTVEVDMFDPLGALLTAVLIGFVYGQRHKFPLRSTLDALTPLFATLAIGLSLSHLAAGTAFGQTTDVRWGIELWNATRHPTQIYEFLAAVVILGIIWFHKPDSPAGTIFLLFVALTAAARLFVEAFRGDSTLILGGLRLAQVIAWILLAAALFAGEWLHREEKVH